MKRLFVVALLLTACAVPVDVSGVSIAVPLVSRELALDKPQTVDLAISGTNETTEVHYVALQYQDGTRWISLNDPIEIALNSSIQVPLELNPGSYKLRTALWGFKPEGDVIPDKVSSDALVDVIDNEQQLADLRLLWNERIQTQKQAFKKLARCDGSEKCIIESLQAIQDFIWASHDLKDSGSITRLTSNLQPQFTSFLYFHNITLGKLEANYLTFCQEMEITASALTTCRNKLQTKDIHKTQKSLKQSLQVLNTLLTNNSYKVIR